MKPKFIIIDGNSNIWYRQLELTNKRLLKNNKLLAAKLSKANKKIESLLTKTK